MKCVGCVLPPDKSVTFPAGSRMECSAVSASRLLSGAAVMDEAAFIASSRCVWNVVLSRTQRIKHRHLLSLSAGVKSAPA